MVTTFYTGTRPDTSVPFFEQTEEGILRRKAILDMVTEHPGVVTSTSTRDHELVSDPNSLSWTLEITHPDVESFRDFMTMIKQLDPSFASDRAAYYKSKGHNLLVEYQIEGMEERGLIANVTPDSTTIRQADGQIITV
jgi:hypothetical protein